LGYYNKTQSFPKPVYLDNRIILGGLKDDVSYESFISANEVYPNIILTQCPVAPHAGSEFVSTIEDAKKMIVEQNIVLWVQLAPSKGGAGMDRPPSRAPHDTCAVFPLEFFSDSSSIHANGISNFQVSAATHRSFTKYSYTLTAYRKTLDTGKTVTQFEVPVTQSNPTDTDSSMSGRMSSIRSSEQGSSADPKMSSVTSVQGNSEAATDLFGIGLLCNNDCRVVRSKVLMHDA